MLFILFLANNVVEIAEIKALWHLHIKMWGAHFTNEFSIFSVITGWIAEMLFMLFFAFIAV